MGLIHSQYWWTSCGVNRIGGSGVVGVFGLYEARHFGVGIHSFAGRGGGNRALRYVGRGSGCGVFDRESVVSISAIFSLIGALLTELWPFIRFMACFDRGMSGCTVIMSGLLVE